MTKKKIIKAKLKPSLKKVKKKVVKKVVSKVKKVPNKKKEDLNCFLTTACVNFYHLADDAYELNTLRHYRDTYLLSSLNGLKLIQEYYLIAPKIVEQIKRDKNKKNIYSYIFTEIRSACQQIESQNMEAAKSTYIRLVSFLIHKYNLVNYINLKTAL